LDWPFSRLEGPFRFQTTRGSVGTNAVAVRKHPRFRGAATLRGVSGIRYGAREADGRAQKVDGFNDIIVGTDGLYTALPNFDMTTGLGTLDVGAKLAVIPH
jgi:hypothetical protein